MSKPGSSSTQTFFDDEFADESPRSVGNNTNSICDDSPTVVTESKIEKPAAQRETKNAKHITLEVYYSRGRDVFKSA